MVPGFGSKAEYNNRIEQSDYNRQTSRELEKLKTTTNAFILMRQLKR